MDCRIDKVTRRNGGGLVRTILAVLVVLSGVGCGADAAERGPRPAAGGGGAEGAGPAEPGRDHAVDGGVDASPRPEQGAAGRSTTGPASTAAAPHANTTEAPARLVVSEVFSDPLLVDDKVGEFVELTNLGPGAVALARLRLRLPSGQQARLERPARPTLAACEAMVVRALPQSPEEAAAAKLRLPNRAGMVELLDGPRVLDRAVWTGRWPWPKHRAGRALERRNAEVPGDRAHAWRVARRPLRRVERASPGWHGLRCAAGKGGVAGTQDAGGGGSRGGERRGPKKRRPE